MVRNLRLAILWAVPLGLVAALLIWPSLELFARGSAVANEASASLIGRAPAAIWFTVWQGAASTALSMLLGIPTAMLLYRRRFFGSRLIRSLMLVPLVLPSIVVAVVFSSFQYWNTFYSIFGIVGSHIAWIITAHVFVNFALTARIVGSSWAALDGETEEAAALDGAGRFRTLWSVVLPQLRGALLASATLTFLFSVSSYGIVLVLGGGSIESIETLMAKSALQFLDLGTASVLALVQTVITLVAVSISRRVSAAQSQIESGDLSEATKRIDRRDWAALVVVIPTVVVFVISPLLNLVSKAITQPDGSIGPANFLALTGRGDRQVLNISVVDAIANSLRNLAISTVLAVAIGLLAVYLRTRWVVSRRTGRAIWISDFIVLLPLGISPVVIALGWLVTFDQEPLALRASWLAIPLIQALLALPLVIRVIQPAIQNLENGIIEASILDGLGSFGSFVRIQLSAIKPVVASAIGFAAIASLGEYGAAAMLTFGDQATLPTVLYQLISRPGSSNYGMAMAASTLLVLLTVLVILVTSGRTKSAAGSIAR